MGTWDYYIVKMSAAELSQNVQFASEVYKDRTLDKAIQRRLDENRVKDEIVAYLKHQPNRFFSAIVVAALDGNPEFKPIKISNDPEFVMFRSDTRFNEAFGALQFDGNQKYYALDGQHRLSAIKKLLKQNNASDGAPKDFENDEISVIVVVPNQKDSNESFMQKYRRLFSNLNRYARKTNQGTDIIMDEDDTFAILTRRLITENTFFHADFQRNQRGHLQSEKIKTDGKNLKTGDSYFTSIETLYQMNIDLLNSKERRFKGWSQGNKEGPDVKTFKKFRPSDDYIDSLYDELSLYWNGLLAELPVLHESPLQMRLHDITDRRNKNGTDHLLFWPIGQQMLAEIARELLNRRLPNPANPTKETVRFALKGLSKLEWRLYQAPWQYFLLVKNARGRWTMRNEQRTPAVRCGRRIQQWVVGLAELNTKQIEELKTEWINFLMPAQAQETIDELWQQVEDQKIAMS